MKKLLLAVIVVGLIAFVGCNNKPTKKEVKPDVPKEQKVETKAPKADKKASCNLPEFKDPEIAKEVKEWKEFMDDYIKAYEKKDMKKVQMMTAKYQECCAKAKELTGKMCEEDAMKWTEIQKKYSEKIKSCSEKCSKAMEH